MALKPDRDVIQTDISYFVTAIAGADASYMQRGGVVVSETGSAPGSGAAMDTTAQAVTYATSASGRRAVGLLMNDVVNLDLSRTHLNQYKEEVQVGSKVCLLKQGYVVTNLIDGNVTGTMPADAYVKTSGYLTPISGAGLPLVGQFLTRADSDGYAKVQINL